MKHYLDTEFIERFHKPFLGKSRHVIDLISIGLVCEDGRKYYAISNEFNPKHASDWVKENVIKQLEPKNCYDLFGGLRDTWKSNKRIAQEIFEFICPYSIANDWADIGSIDDGGEAYLKANPPEFYGYYADYDWVLFCSLFGTMMQLPNGFPMYCIDLKQTLDEHAERYSRQRHVSKDQILKEFKSSPLYPKQSNEHNALDDAKWNKELHHFLNNLK